jgi:two-component system sensor histidine kinase UhpB
VPKPLRLLLVEDDPGDAMLLISDLRQGGFEPAWLRVETADAFRQALGAQTWNLVISDYYLPTFTGLEALAILRDTGLDIPFLVISGAIGEETAVAAMKAGASDYLMKHNLVKLVPTIERELRDAEARRQARVGAQNRNESAERLRLAVEVAQLGTFDWDLVADRIVVDDRLLAVLGLPAGTVMGKFADCLPLVYAPDRADVEQATADALAGGEIQTREYRIVRSDGNVRWVASKTEIFRDAAGQPLRMIGVLQDIHDLKTAEEGLRTSSQRLQHLSRQLLDAQETERRHFARELHDEIGQSLTAAIITLKLVEQSPAAAAVARDLHEAGVLLETTLQQVRAMSLDLRPALLDDLGLVPALNWYLDRVGQRSGLRVHLQAEGLPRRLPTEVETVCFRVVQEALTNIVRHARASSARVDLRGTAAQLELRIVDDGAGFDVPAAKARAQAGASLGLLSMEERLSLVGGSLTVQSAEGQGCRIFACLPLPACPTCAEITVEEQLA